MVELGVRGWRAVSYAMLLGTFGYGGFIALDLATGDPHGGGEIASAAKAGEGGAGLRLKLGREATPAEIAAWDIDIRPDGAGLPEGRGDVATGETLFAEQCASCHGDFGEGVGRWPVLAGGAGTLASDDPVKTVGSYWPYLSTVWDYVHRAMPFGDAQSLSDDEVYAITAYLLYANDLVDDDFELSHENFAATRLPNEANFFMDDREQSPLFAAREVCMRDCKQSVEITMRARVLDVTPENAEGDPAREAPAQKTAEARATSAPTKATETVDVAVAGGAIDAALAEAGESVFKKKCRACHKVGPDAKNGRGPALNGIHGAVVGAVDGFKYSKVFQAKQAEGVTWDDAALSAFLEKPKAWAPRTRMTFAGLRKAKERDAVIEYLKSQEK